MITIKISGPGLVVNGPAVAIRKGLIAAGYAVEVEEWKGLHQGPNGETITETWEECYQRLWADKGQHITTVKMEVTPLPWGG